jgi:hypothetical protein
MEYWCGIGDAKAVDEWAEDELLNNSEPHPDVCELFGKSKEETRNLLFRIAQDQGFVPVSEAGEKEAIEILIEISEKLINEEITPEKFCYVVTVFDTNFLGFRKIDKGIIEYPPWLGDLYASCDECDKTWTNSNSPHLIEEVKKMLQINRKRLNT